MVALATGCATGPHRPPERVGAITRIPPDWNGAVTASNPAPAVAQSVINAPPPVVPPVAVAAPVVPEARWIALNRWALDHGYGALRRLTTKVPESFALVSPQGVLTLTIASVIARWQGTEVHLGAAPQISEAGVAVSTLDLHKNIEPLLTGFEPIIKPGRLVVIDPGHGGSNAGTRSVAGERGEKAYTLDWALRLRPLLEARGWRVLLTRTNDTDVSLADRVAFAENHQADLFLSLHFNSAGEAAVDAAGLETFCFTPAGMSSTLIRGSEDDANQPAPNNTYDAQNLRLAVRLQSALVQACGYADRGVRRARFLTVLRGQNRPAALIEGGFLSNPTEARRVADPAFRQKLAMAVAEALK